MAYLINFNQSISQVISSSMQDVSEFVFINMANVTLLRHDSYLDLLKPRVKFDTVAALRTSPLCMTSRFPGSIIPCTEKEIKYHNDMRYSGGSDRCHPYYQSGKQTLEGGKKAATPAWNQLRNKVPEQMWLRQALKLLTATGQELYFLQMTITVLPPETLFQSCQTLNVNCSVASCTFCHRAVAKESSFIVKQGKKLKYVKGASCVDQLSSDSFSH